MADRDEQRIDVIGTAIDATAILVGGATGTAVGMMADRYLPQAVSTVSKVGRHAAVYGSGITAQWLTSTAVAEDLHEMRSMVSRARIKATKMFKKNDHRKKHHHNKVKNEIVATA